MTFLLKVASVALNAYLISLLCFSLPLLIGWMLGVRVGWIPAIRAVGWGAAAIVLVVYLALLV